MLDINLICDQQLCPNPLPQVVNVPNPMYKSLQGRYFIGQSAKLIVGGGNYAWAALVNPECSHRDLFFNVFTISNFSPSTITAQLWLNTNPPGDYAISSQVSPTNTTLSPPPEHKVQLQYVQSTDKTPEGGVNIFDRIAPPLSTLASEEDGKIIVPPGGNVVLFLKAPNTEPIETIVAFGWWEA